MLSPQEQYSHIDVWWCLPGIGHGSSRFTIGELRQRQAGCDSPIDARGRCLAFTSCVQRNEPADLHRVGRVVYRSVGCVDRRRLSCPRLV